MGNPFILRNRRLEMHTRRESCWLDSILSYSIVKIISNCVFPAFHILVDQICVLDKHRVFPALTLNLVEAD